MGVQVDLATKYRDSEGNLIPLSINQRQFISFSYGGENIENFDLLAVFTNDRLDKGIYSPFNDITSENEVVDGQIFWASILKAGTLSFNLATDGMTSENYEAFKNWFSPGQSKELILTEFPNRAILARVSAPPQISLLPFEDKKTFKIAGVEKEISTSLYKGDITLEFVMDDPYWYSLESYIDDSAENYSYKEEELKIIYEDKIPSAKMFSKNSLTDIFLLGNNKIIQNGIAKDSVGVNLNSESSVYLYNCGTAAAKPILSFSIKPEFDDGSLFIIVPSNSYASSEFSALTIGGENLIFTTPSLFTSYNQALTIVNEVQTGDSILDLRRRLRDELYNYYTRAWAIAIIDSLKGNTSYVESAGGILNRDTFIRTFSAIMQICIIDSELHCTINSKTGEVKIKTTCKIASGKIDSVETAQKMADVSIEENAGDMIKSKYLKLEDRTIFNSNGEILKEDCLKISSTCNLTNLKIDFKYTYL